MSYENPDSSGGLVSRVRFFFQPPQIKTEKSGLARETTKGHGPQMRSRDQPRDL